MLEFDEEKRINWEELFVHPLLKMKDEQLEKLNLLRYNAPQIKIDFDIESFEFECTKFVQEPELKKY